MKKSLGYFAVVFSAVIFGVVPLLVRIIYSQGGNPFSVIFYRLFLPLPVLYIILKKFGDLSISRDEFKEVLVVSLLGYGLTGVLLFSAYDHLSTGAVTILHFTYPIFVVLGDTFIFKERPSWIKILCIFLCISGVVLFTQDIALDGYLGFFLALSSGLSYAFYMVYVERTSLRTMNPFKLTFYMGLVSSFFILGLILVKGDLALDLGVLGWGVSFLMAGLTSLVGVSFFNYGIQTIGSQNASILSSFEPITSLLVGITVFSEPFSLRIGLGCLLILSSVVITAISEKRKNPI